LALKEAVGRVERLVELDQLVNRDQQDPLDHRELPAAVDLSERLVCPVILVPPDQLEVLD